MGILALLAGAATIGVLSAVMGLAAGLVVRGRPEASPSEEQPVEGSPEELAARVRDLTRRLDEARAEASRLRAQYVSVVEAKDARIAWLEGAVRQTV